MKFSCAITIKLSNRKHKFYAKIKENVDSCIYLQDISKLINLLIQALLLFQILENLILKQFYMNISTQQYIHLILSIFGAKPLSFEKKNGKITMDLKSGSSHCSLS